MSGASGEGGRGRAGRWLRGGGRALREDRKSCKYAELIARKRWVELDPEMDGRVPKWPKGADCKSAGASLHWFESSRAH